MTLRPSRSCASKMILSSLALLTFLFGITTPAAWAQQGAKAAVADRPASPSDPAAAAETAAAVLERIAHSGLPERGAHDAKVTIVFFDDFQCPFSAVMYQTLFNDVIKNYGDQAKVIIRPLANSRSHPWAKHAAINASCLASQSQDAYWEFADYVHANQSQIGGDANTTLDKFTMDVGGKHELSLATLRECLAAQPDAVIKESYVYVKQSRRYSGSTLFVNGEKIQAAVPAKQVRDAIDHALLAGVPISGHGDQKSLKDSSGSLPNATNSKENPK